MPAFWDKTIHVVERLKREGRIKHRIEYLPEKPCDCGDLSKYKKKITYWWTAPDGHEYRIIGRDTPIDGGVYLGEGPREAILVDFENDRWLREFYEEVKEKCFDGNGVFRKDWVLLIVYDAVRRKMVHDENKFREITKVRGAENDEPYPLGFFIYHGIGFCRHKALACAAILERLGREGFIRGKVSVDRNYIPKRGGHAWCRYTNSVGEVYILDPNKGFIGTLEEAKRDGRWEYARPEDKFMYTL